MSDTLVLFLPHADADYRWLRVAGDSVVARGEGLPEVGDDATVAIAPAGAVALHWAELPDRSAAQATAAARILAAEASAAPIAELHVAVGREDSADRPIGVVAASIMQGWLRMLAERGVDPQAILPAPMLLPRPESGYVRADLGGAGVVRGTASGFADEARLTDLVTGGTPPAVLDRGAIEAAIAAAVAAPALDLRQGVFARRRRRALDWALVRRLAMLAGTILLVTLAISLVRIVRYNLAADAAEAQADTLARSGLPRGESVGDAGRQLDDRLLGLRGPGQGFSRTLAAVYAAVGAAPGSEVTRIDFAENGELRVGLATETEGQVNDLLVRLRASGFTVRAGVFASAGGRVSGDVTVAPQ